MKFIQKNNWIVILGAAVLLGALAFGISLKKGYNDSLLETKERIMLHLAIKTNSTDEEISSMKEELKLLSEGARLSEFFESTNSGIFSDTEKLKLYFKGDSGNYNHPYLNLHNEFYPWAKSVLTQHGFYNLLVVNKYGDVVFSVLKEDEFGANLLKGEYANTNLGQTYRSLVESTANYSVSDFASFPMGNSRAYAFIASVKRDSEGNIIGGIIAQLPPEQVFSELGVFGYSDSIAIAINTNHYNISSNGTKVPLSEWNEKMDSTEYLYLGSEQKICGMWTVIVKAPLATIWPEQNYTFAILNSFIVFFSTLIAGVFILVFISKYKQSKGITHSDIMLVQTSWNKISEHSTEVIKGFYMHLFNIAPQLKPLFKSEQSQQEKRMASMVNTIVNSIDSLDEFRASITPLAKSHVHMNVKTEYFQYVVTSLINSVADQYGNDFTPTHRKAWNKVLGQISAIMIEEMAFYRKKIEQETQS